MERKYGLRRGKGKTKQVTRRQLPITAAYAFTDYLSQGQTIKRAIVEIARPPSGGPTPFNAYVALFRSSGREIIRLLRDFKDKLFTKTPCEKLKEEDITLQRLNRRSKLKYDAGEDVWDSCLLRSDDVLIGDVDT
ncbi:hypothetical protein BDV93DRAFT_604303 [Ceratobasidium sp. AG-I]|nr:hypothetical protein BDV93DRAFT_604303 [Ceratobasidium sp. AG-I]